MKKQTLKLFTKKELQAFGEFCQKHERDRIIELISRAKCIDCNKKMDVDGWKIPLCRKCRLKFMETK